MGSAIRRRGCGASLVFLGDLFFPIDAWGRPIFDTWATDIVSDHRRWMRNSSAREAVPQNIDGESEPDFPGLVSPSRLSDTAFT